MKKTSSILAMIIYWSFVIFVSFGMPHLSPNMNCGDIPKNYHSYGDEKTDYEKCVDNPDQYHSESKLVASLMLFIITLFMGIPVTIREISKIKQGVRT